MYEYEYVDYNCQRFIDLNTTNTDKSYDIYDDWNDITSSYSDYLDSDLISSLDTLNLICTYDVEIKWIEHNSTTEPFLLSIYGHLNQDIDNEAWGFSNLEIKYYSSDQFTNQTASPTTPSPTDYPTSEPTQEPTLNPTEEPTYEPTFEPTQEPTIEPTKNDSNNSDDIATVIVVTFVIIVLIIFLVAFILFRRRKQANERYKYGGASGSIKNSGAGAGAGAGNYAQARTNDPAYGDYGGAAAGGDYE